MFLSAFERPDFEQRTAIICRGHEFTYGEIAQEARDIAGGLQALDVGRGDRVGLFFRNSDEFIAAYLATYWTGATAVPLRHYDVVDWLIDYANALGVKLIVADDGLIDRVTSRATSTRTIVPASAVRVGRDPTKYRRVANDGKPLVITHTSGSTAQPKAVMQDLAALNARARALIEYLPFQADDVICMVSLLSHGFGLHTLATATFAVGATLMMFAEPDPRHTLIEAAKYRATILGTNPTALRHLLRAARNVPELPKLRFAIGSTDKVPNDIALQWQELFGCPLLEAWGMTESCSCALFNRPDDHEIGTVGRPMPGVAARIVGADGQNVPDGEVGELWLAGDFLASGYWGDPRNTAQRFGGGWLKTGDQFVRQANGRYRFIGRTPSVLKVGGITLSPFEVEAAIERHPSVSQCVAIGTPSEEWGQEIEAFVVLSSPVSADDLHRHAKKTLSWVGRPARFWSVPEIPVTSAGKIARKIEAYAQAKALL
jgi:long-chain acyl-CoA synthetase